MSQRKLGSTPIFNRLGGPAKVRTHNRRWASMMAEADRSISAVIAEMDAAWRDHDKQGKELVIYQGR